MVRCRLSAMWLLLLGVVWSKSPAVNRDVHVAGGRRPGRAWSTESDLAELRSSSKSVKTTLEMSSPEACGPGLTSTRRFLRKRRSSLTHVPLGHPLPQMKPNSDPLEVSFFILIHNMASAALGSNLSQVSVRDSISGIVPVRSEARQVERGFQSFTIDTLYAGSQVVLNYSAFVSSSVNDVLELPAFLTFSNASQNDVRMFGPLTANLTLRINAANKISLDHGLHFAGFVGGFLSSLLLVTLSFLAAHWIDPGVTLRFCQSRRKTGGLAEFADTGGNGAESLKDEAAFENKMVDVMILEEPQNMVQALESLEMASLLHASNQLEAGRLQIHKALVFALLSHSRPRLPEVVQGQVMAAEGRLKEQLEGRMAALAARCNRETREALEAEHLRQREEQEQMERLCQQGERQMVLPCGRLMEKLHKLRQGWLQRHLLVRHEQASAQVQREITEQRRVELHMIFCEELEEATRLGEMDHSTSATLQHQYFTAQDLLEDILDELVAHQRFVLSERQAQRSFLLQSLQSLHNLIAETFSNSSKTLDDWLSHIRRLGLVTAGQLKPLCDNTQQQAALLRRQLEEDLAEEKRALRTGLLKRRKELLSDMLLMHRQQLNDLSSSSIPLCLNESDILQMFHIWRNLLSSHSSEMSELIKRLDEEAAADIRKVMMRLLEGKAIELRAIRSSVTQSLQTMVSPGQHHLLQTENTGARHEGQTREQRQGVQLRETRLQQEGRTALLTLNTTREQLQGALQRELMEQRETRGECRAFFRRLCSCQLALSEADQLQMKLEFHKCFSAMDRCVVLPPVVHKAKLHCALENWRSDQEALIGKTRSASKRKSGPSKHRQDSELQRFQNSLQEQVSLFERLTEQEAAFRDQVAEEMEQDRKTSLLSQASVLSSQLISGQLEKVQSWSRALQTWTALTSMQKLLIQEITQRDKMADCVLMHWEGLIAAEEQFHKDLSSLPDSSQTTNPVLSGCSGSDCDGSTIQPQADSRMVTILQEALHKREQLLSEHAQSCEQWTSGYQVTQQLQEQLELKRLQQLCHQELQFVSGLLKLCHVPPGVLREMVRLLLPLLPENELLSLTEALCPKQSPADIQRSGSSSTLNDGLAAKLKEDIIRKAVVDAPASPAQTEGVDEKRRGLLLKLLPLSFDPAPPAASALRIQPKEPESKSDSQAPLSGPSDTARPSADQASPEPQGPDHGTGLFVFRDAPPPTDTPGGTSRKRKRNFLNFKKNMVLPIN